MGVLHAEDVGQRFAGVRSPDGVAHDDTGVVVVVITESEEPRRSLDGARGQTMVRQAVVAALLGVQTEAVGDIAGRQPAGSPCMETPLMGELRGAQ
mmetsp:Transcript_62703/g.183408  ORF Transcript_62703/g.183408 Transcript_62703/m.183408 type:complete len:96 (-) Transcript_62703:186-473(-)